MLRYLSIQHLAVIERLEIDFDAGFTVLTGETGAGKSILVEAVGLLLGARASSDLVRTGEQLATIQAIFDTAREDVIVRREITAQGRSRAFVNGALATSGALRDLAGRLLEMHGQHEHQGLLVADSHLDLLDGYAGLEPSRDEVAALHQRVTALRAERDTLRLDERQKLARLDLLHLPARRDREGGTARRARTTRSRPNGRCWPTPRSSSGWSAEAYELLYDRDDAVLGALTVVWKRVADLAARGPARAAVPRRRARSSLRNWRTSRSSCATTPSTSTRRPGGCRTWTIASACSTGSSGSTVRRSPTSSPTPRRAARELDGPAVVRRARGGGRGAARTRPRASIERHAEQLSDGAAGRPRRGSPENWCRRSGDLAMGRTRFEVRFEPLPAEAVGPQRT